MNIRFLFHGLLLRTVMMVCVSVAGGFLSQAQAQDWLPTNGPYSAALRCMAMARDSSLMIGTTYGVFRSTTGGTTWSVFRSDLQDTMVRALTSTASGALLVVSSRGTVIRCVDGEAARSVSFAPSRGAGYAADVSLLTAPDAPVFLVSRVVDSILRSTDDGTTWSRIGSLPGTPIAALLLTRDSLLMTTDDGLYLSRDSAMTWRKINVDTIGWVGHLVAADGSLFVLNGDGDVLRSTDNGVHWAHEISVGWKDEPWFLHNGADGDVLFGMSSGLTRRDARINRWSFIGSFEDLQLQPQFFLPVGGDTLIEGSAGGVNRSTDRGRSWSVSNTGLAGRSSREIVVDDASGTIYNPDYFRLRRSSDLGSTWESCGFFEGTANTVCVTRTGALLVGCTDGIRRSTDDGRSWTLDTIPSAKYSRSVSRIVRGGRNDLYAILTSTDRLRRSTDDGITWRATKDTASEGGNHLAVGGNGDLYLGKRGEVLRSTDNGSSWSRIHTLSSGNVVGLRTTSNGDVYIVGYATGVTRYASATSSFENIGPPDSATYGPMVITPGGDIFLGTSLGVYRRDGATGAWSSVNAGLSRRVGYLAQHPSGHLFASVYGGTVQRTSERVSAVPDAGSGVVPSLTIAPIPAINHITLDFALGRAAIVSVELVSVSGVSVLSQAGGYLEEGPHRIHIDVGGLPAGAYLCRLHGGGMSEAKVVTIVP